MAPVTTRIVFILGLALGVFIGVVVMANSLYHQSPRRRFVEPYEYSVTGV